MYFPSIIFERTKEKKGKVKDVDSCRWNDWLRKKLSGRNNPILPLFYSES